MDKGITRQTWGIPGGEGDFQWLVLSVISEIVSVQRVELEEEIEGLKAEAERVAEEARELVGEVPF
jgi:hypothetical protein